MKDYKSKISEFIDELFSKKKVRKKKRVSYKVIFVSDNPSYDEIRENQMIVVGGKGYRKWAYFKCPSGCGEVIVLSLTRGKFPNWKLVVNKEKKPTLYPSVWKKDGCKSHFYIKKGKVKWVDDYFTSPYRSNTF